MRLMGILVPAACPKTAKACTQLAFSVSASFYATKRAGSVTPLRARGFRGLFWGHFCRSAKVRAALPGQPLGLGLPPGPDLAVVAAGEECSGSVPPPAVYLEIPAGQR